LYEIWKEVSWLSTWIGKKMAKPFAPMIKLGLSTQGAFGKAFYERYGEEALPTIAQVMGEYAAKTAKMAKSRLKGKGMKAVGELLKMYQIFDMFETMEIIELSDDVIHMKSSPCPFGLEGTTRELCEAVDKKMWEVVVSTLVGKKAEVKVLKCLAAGDEYCEVICSTKK